MSIIKKWPIAAIILLLSQETHGIQQKYKSDDMDDLLEGVITNKHKE